MKKLIIAFIAIFVSTFATFADDTCCRVYGTDNVATITNAVVYDNDNHTVSAKVELTKYPTDEIRVVVNVSDGNRIIASGVVRITQGSLSQSVGIQNPAIKEGEAYYLTIARATCQ